MSKAEAQTNVRCKYLTMCIFFYLRSVPRAIHLLQVDYSLFVFPRIRKEEKVGYYLLPGDKHVYSTTALVHLVNGTCSYYVKK